MTLSKLVTLLHEMIADYSMISMSNSKSRAFSLEEMMAITQKFSQKTGQGDFGSVFFGNLLEGKHIAVKFYHCPPNKEFTSSGTRY